MARRDEVILSLLEEGAGSQLELSRRLGVSLSAVNAALRPLDAMGAVEIRRRGLRMLDARKAALYFATHQSIARKTAYATRVEKPVSGIEGEMPAGVAFTAYSGYKLLYGEVPADYGEAYVYAGGKALEEIRRRFPENGGRPNLVALSPDPTVERLAKKGIAPKFQVFADLWNLREWYAADFLKAMEARLFG